MKRIEPIKKPLTGEISVPGDKSIAHRAVILGSIAEGCSRVFNLSGGDDNSRTVRAFKQMGVEIFRDGEALCIDGKGWDGLRAPGERIDCGNSGTTMRLLSGVLAGRRFSSELDGDASLRQRPMQRIIDPLKLMGANIRSKSENGLAPLEIHGGNLTGVRYRMPVASAQVKSAIVLAALQARGVTVLEEPQKSRDHTEVMLRGFGGNLGINGSLITIEGGQNLRAQDIRVPGDISSAAFFLVAARDHSWIGFDDPKCWAKSDPRWRRRNPQAHGHDPRVLERAPRSRRTSRRHPGPWWRTERCHCGARKWSPAP